MRTAIYSFAALLAGASQPGATAAEPASSSVRPLCPPYPPSSGTASDCASTNAGLALPPDADRKLDQREHVAAGFYLSKAGVRTPLPAPGERRPDGDGIPSASPY